MIGSSLLEDEQIKLNLLFFSAMLKSIASGQKHESVPPKMQALSTESTRSETASHSQESGVLPHQLLSPKC